MKHFCPDCGEHAEMDDAGGVVCACNRIDYLQEAIAIERGAPLPVKREHLEAVMTDVRNERANLQATVDWNKSAGERIGKLTGEVLALQQENADLRAKLARIASSARLLDRVKSDVAALMEDLAA